VAGWERTTARETPEADPCGMTTKKNRQRRKKQTTTKTDNDKERTDNDKERIDNYKDEMRGSSLRSE
jgi:hypothetical protein